MILIQQAIQQAAASTMGRVIAGFCVGLVCLLLGFSSPAYADNASESGPYITPDGRDITTVAECIPPRLSEGNLDRALRESGNDFLEKVFSTKDSYEEYELDDTEIEYLECLKRNGVTPEVEKNKA